MFHDRSLSLLSSALDIFRIDVDSIEGVLQGKTIFNYLNIIPQSRFRGKFIPTFSPIIDRSKEHPYEYYPNA
jgi:hypothetical protein